ncbi:ATP-dependent DNA helicase Q4 isoform X3 [Gopherus flavomarginatus]|uniref:ATP-dependent DNA helicase Q4 isoform X3 n=1 Tax=Gopherus flavomarginatus TaxID=286002 RepID=UPI0021CBEEE9|nr:ATP-dependent DNA helicase Q4 isoform X3 [Gopherus flavomarginatus]
MDRYNEVKVLLKKWEMTFLQEHQRKPSKTDMEEAPEETKKLYREYKALKQAREHQGSPESSSVFQQAAKETPAVEQVPDSGCWGAHLNRGQTAPKLSHQDRDSLKASAQYFGMKLKANLGAAIKERPITLRKSLTPRGKPAVPLLEKSSDNSNQGASPKPPQMPSLKSSKDCVTNADPNESGDLLLPPSISRLAPTILSAGLKPSPEVNKFQQLKQTVAQRLGSLDPGWLDRCQGIREKVGERSREESASTSNGRNKDQTKAGCALQGNVAQPLHDRSLNQTTGARAQSLESEHVPPLGNCLLGSWKLQEHQDPSRRNWQGAALEGDDLIKGGGDDCRVAVKDEQGTSETQMNSRMDSSLGAAEISIAKEHISKPKNLPKDAHQGAELEKLGNAARGEGGASCRTGDGSSQPKQVKVTNRKRQRMAMASRDDGAAGPEDGAVAPKRRRTNASAGDNPVSVKKKARGAVCEPKPGENNLEEDGESVEAKEEKGRNVPMLSENLLGEVEGEGKHKWSSRASVCRAPPKKDGNFVRLNLKKKSHVKGYALRGHRLRKQVWKQKWQKKSEWFGGGGRCFDRSSDTCFRCGGTGHWASECKGRELGPAVGPQPEENSEAIEEEMPLPTLEEVARMTNTAYSKISAESRSSQAGPERAGEEEFDLHMQRPVYEPPTPPPPMEPLYGLGQDGKVRETPEEVFQALAELGYSAFRQGQEVAVMRILSGLSTLVVLSTGMGKSLCYQLPAYLYAKRSKCITLVISPLVSLMDDQVSGLPPDLKAVCIHSNMSKSQREAAVERVKGGKVHVLLLSPEALVGGGRVGSSCLPSADQLPPVAFACIDEAHCVSEWSHNFRPCYLRLCKVLRDRLGVRCLLGLTATATLATARDVAHHLGIQEEEGIAVRSAAVPPNLHLSVSTDRDKDQGGEVLDAEMMELMRASEEQACRDDRMSGQQRVCYKHERAIPMQQTVESLDIREEGIETLLCYLELHPQCWVEMLHPTFSSCRVVCYGGPQQLRATAKSSPPVAVCLARERLAGVDHTHASSVEFDVIALSDSMGWEVLPVKRALRQLQWSTQLQKGCHGTGKSGILVEFGNLSFHLRSYGDLTDREIDSVCNFLHHRVTARETATLCQLQACFRAFQSVACQASALYSERVDKERSSRLKALLMDYFEKKPALDETELMCREDEEAEDLNNIKLQEWEGQIRSDIRNFLSIRQDEKFSGRAIARIFHGIGSPCYPAQVYGRDRRFWRKYIHFDFNRIMRLATEEIIRCK